MCLFINSTGKIRQQRLKSIAKDKTPKHELGIFLRVLGYINN